MQGRQLYRNEGRNERKKTTSRVIPGATGGGGKKGYGFERRRRHGRASMEGSKGVSFS